VYAPAVRRLQIHTFGSEWKEAANVIQLATELRHLSILALDDDVYDDWVPVLESARTLSKLSALDLNCDPNNEESSGIMSAIGCFPALQSLNVRFESGMTTACLTLPNSDASSVKMRACGHSNYPAAPSTPSRQKICAVPLSLSFGFAISPNRRGTGRFGHSIRNSASP